MRRFFFLMLTSIFTIKAFAFTAHIDGIYYYFKGENAIVTYYSGLPSENENAYEGEVVIPESVIYNGKTYTVNAIGDAAFSCCRKVSSIYIPTSINSIGNYAFQSCTFKSITMPESVTSIGEDAFRYCKELVSLIIPNSVISIGRRAFYVCEKLTSISIGENVISIGPDAFECCYNLKSIVLPPKMTKIEDGVFNECHELNSVKIPNNVISIGKYAFADCKSLQDVTIPEKVESIFDNAFLNCTKLNKVHIGSLEAWLGIKFYNEYSNPLLYGNHLYYDENSEIENLVVPAQITSIPAYAFIGCKSIKNVYIPNTITSIGTDAFANCDNLKRVNINDLEIWRNIEFTNKNSNPLYYAHHLFLNGEEVNHFVIKDDIPQIEGLSFIGIASLCLTFECSEIGTQFRGNTNITEIIIGNEVESISISAFEGCSELKSAVIGNRVKVLPEKVFSGCPLQSLTIGSNVQTIESNRYSSGNTSATKVIWLTNTPPKGYKNVNGTINYTANESYSELSSVTVYPFLSSMFEVGGVKYVPISPSDRTCDAIDCVYDESANNIRITSTVSYKNIAMTVKNMQPYVAYKNKHIKTLLIDFDGAISDNAFTDCYNMESVEVGKKVTSIGKYAFNNCSSLQSAKLESGTILESAFAGCKQLKTVSLGNKITSIGGNAFINCTSLETIVIPDAVSSIGDNAFYYCTGMKSTIIGNGVTSIGQCAYSGCSSLSKLTIGSQVKDIKDNAFQDCKTLPSVIIPKSVTNIRNNVFFGCEGLKKVIIADRNEELTLGSNDNQPLFSSCPLDTVYIGGNISYQTSSNYGYSPFYRNTSLRAIHITDKETEISTNEFYGCSNLQIVRIGDGVTTIGDWAFSGCQSLKLFAFGTQLKNIGKEAFSDCTAVTEIISKAATPPVCGSQALDDINKWECKLYVPKGCMASYESANQWKDFFFTEEGTGTTGQDNPEQDVMGDINNDSKVDESDIKELADLIMSNTYNTKGDMNKDGKVNAVDLVLLTKNVNNK